MKKNTLITFSLVFGLLLFLFACRKDIEYYIKDREQPSSSRVESAKIWRLQHINKSGRRSRTVLQPHWDHSWLVKRAKGAHFLVVPATERAVTNRKFNIRRFFVFSLAGSMVSDGKIVEILGENYNIDDHLDPLLESLNRDQITGFNGAVYNYDIDYNFLSSDVYKDGNKTNMRSKIVSSSEPNLKIADVVTTSSDCDYITPIRIGYPASFCSGALISERIDYIYDEDGCLYFASFTYLSHTCPGQGGGSGSGGNGLGSGSGAGSDSPPYGGPGGPSGPGQPPTFKPVEIKLDSLRSKFPCVVKYVIDELDKISKYKQLADPFRTQNSAPHLQWNAKPLDWNNNGVYRNGETGVLVGSSTGMSSEITLNSMLIQNGSKIMVAATAIHESYHAYIRYVYVQNIPPSNSPSDVSFMGSHWNYLTFKHNGDTDYNTHKMALDTQLDNFVEILREFGGKNTNGNYNYSLNDTRMAMLIGMNNAGPNATAAQIQQIQQYYDSALNRFGLTQSQVNSFNTANVSAPNNQRVPTNCP